VARRGVAAIVALVVLVSPSESSATTTTRAVAGSQGSIACLTPTRCVAVGYTSKVVGDVVSLTRGVPGRTSVVAGSQSVSGVSCPSSRGCVALVRTISSARAELLSINAHGIATRARSFALPGGVALFRIACVSLRRCVLVGDDIADVPPPIVVASFDGTSLHLHLVRVPAKTVETVMQAVTCAGGTCDEVGYLDTGSSAIGVSLEISGETAFALHAAGSDLLDGVACTATLCYAVGTTGTGGVVDALTRGAVVSRSPIQGVELSAIACGATDCTAVGRLAAQPPSTDLTWGALVPIPSGAPGAPVVVEASAALTGVAGDGTAIVAVGSAQGAGSVVAVE
jgi:hypothetical protein